MYEEYNTVDERVKKIMGAARNSRAAWTYGTLWSTLPLSIEAASTTYYEIESVTFEPSSAAEIERCKNFLM